MPDEAAGTQQPGDKQDDPRHHRGDEQAVMAVRVDHAVDDDDEGTGRPTDLDAAAAKCGNKKSRDDRSDETRSWRPPEAIAWQC